MKEQLYQDFTEKVLPHIQEGLVITQEYFTDLFGRYVKYLFVTDILWAIMLVILAIGVTYIVYRTVKWIHSPMGQEDVYMVVALLCFVIVLIFGGLVYTIRNIAKDIYVPEVRVYQELMPTNN